MIRIKSLVLSTVVFLLISVFVKAQVANINLSSTKQYIDGFGASTAWHGAISDDQANYAFSNGNDKQMGLSICRLRIDPRGSGSWGSELSNAKKAKARGATIFATPWTPPASMKTNGSTIKGELKTDQYGAYANYLKEYCNYMSSNGVSLYAISIQNEPDWLPDYESCGWSPSQMKTFLDNNAYVIPVKVLGPETVHPKDDYYNVLKSASQLDIYGDHLYGKDPQNYSGKKHWMTEHFVEGDDASAYVTMGKEILDCMAKNMNAYVWWWLAYPDHPTNLISSSGPTKKGYILSQFSKFVRSGYYRVDATYSPQSGVYVCAFKGANTVVVVVNQNTSSKKQTFSFQNGTVTSVSKRTTSSSKNLSNDGTIAVSNNSFTTTLDAQSVTTFIGVSGSGCTPTAITPYLQINDGAWQQTNSATVNSGDKIKFGPQPSSGGSWSWSGCGTSGASREQTLYPTSSCTALVTYTNTEGCTSTQDFNITVNGGGNIIVRAKGVEGDEQIQLQSGGSIIATWTLSVSYQDYSASASGDVSVHFINDQGSRDVQIDYVQINGTTYQAEDQVTNTAVWQDGSCGGSYSEWLHCNGYIDFVTSSKSTKSLVVTTDITEVQNDLDVKYYPIPVDNMLNIEFSEELTGSADIYLIDITGKAVRYDKANGSSHILDMSGLPNGLYMVRIIGTDLNTTERLVKQ